MPQEVKVSSQEQLSNFYDKLGNISLNIIQIYDKKNPELCCW
jgi:hypothetical protein